MAASFRNQAFLVLVGLTVLQILAGIMASSIDYYLLVYHMCDGDIMVGSVWKAILSMGYAIIGIAAIFPTKWLAIRFGKQSALGIIFFLFWLALGGNGFFTPQDRAVHFLRGSMLCWIRSLAWPRPEISGKF